nr:ATP-dependent RNA helicase [Treponema sp.]
DKSKLNACGNLRGKIETRDKGTLLEGEKLSLIIKLAKELDLNPIAEKKWNRHMNVNIYDQLQKEQLIDSLDWILRTSIAKQKGREYGFITLYTDAKGNYWFKVSRGFSTALAESHSSLETLIDESVEFSADGAKKINSVLALVNKFYE